MSSVKYQPQGAMCLSCTKANNNCTDLNFKDMPVVDSYENINIVKCTEYVNHPTAISLFIKQEAVTTKTTLTTLLDDNRKYKEKFDIVAGNLLISADHVLDNSISRMSYYTDEIGATSSSPAGLARSINSRIKTKYGVKREDMSGLMKQHCAVLCVAIAQVIDVGMNTKQLRGEIKQKIGKLITNFAEQWHSIKGELNG